jgi:hypothetical protein
MDKEFSNFDFKQIPKKIMKVRTHAMQSPIGKRLPSRSKERSEKYTENGPP